VAKIDFGLADCDLRRHGYYGPDPLQGISGRQNPRPAMSERSESNEASGTPVKLFIAGYEFGSRIRAISSTQYLDRHLPGWCKLPQNTETFFMGSCHRLFF
jgi:hypothetical protein